MKVIGIEDYEVVAIFEMLAAVLKIGNTEFKHQNNFDGTDGCRIINAEG